MISIGYLPSRDTNCSLRPPAGGMQPVLASFSYSLDHAHLLTQTANGGGWLACEAPTNTHVTSVRARVERLQARYNTTRSHDALCALKNGVTALMAAENEARRE